MKIAYFTHTNPNDKKAWSGTHFYIKEALAKQGVCVREFGPLKNTRLTYYKLFRKALQSLVGRRISEYHMSAVTASFAKSVDQVLSRSRQSFDYLFFPAGSHLLSNLRSTTPAVLSSDACFPAMVDYYPQFRNLTKGAIMQGVAAERQAIQNAEIILYSSGWALESAADAYGNQVREKSHMIPYGANVDICHNSSIVETRNVHDRAIRILFVASSWDRKGGPLAYKTAKLLNERGINTTLVVCGQKPPKRFCSAEFLEYVGFLDKNNLIQKQMIDNLYMSSDFFMLPTRFECAGIVFCEASAFALPILTSSTGGVETYAKHGMNAIVATLDDDEEFYAEMITKLWGDSAAYRSLCAGAWQYYSEELNWETWGKRVIKILTDRVAQGISQAKN